MYFRKANETDLRQLRALGIKAWEPFNDVLDTRHRKSLLDSIMDPATYADLLSRSDCIVCENAARQLIGMAFLIPRGNPTEIYASEWCHLRFVSVDPDYQGKGIGTQLTDQCIRLALKNGETVMALHTSGIMHNARHIYEKRGFRRVRELEPRLGLTYWLYTLDLREVGHRFQDDTDL